MTTPLFLLRCVQLGLSLRDLDLVTIGMVNDMYAESGNDEYKGYKELATQVWVYLVKSKKLVGFSDSGKKEMGNTRLSSP